MRQFSWQFASAPWFLAWRNGVEPKNYSCFFIKSPVCANFAAKYNSYFVSEAIMREVHVV